MSKNIEILASAIEAKSQLMEEIKGDKEKFKDEIMNKIKKLFVASDKGDDTEVCEQISELCNILLQMGIKFNKFDIYGKKISKYI